jgi:hypothetical protein
LQKEAHEQHAVRGATPNKSSATEHAPAGTKHNDNIHRAHEQAPKICAGGPFIIPSPLLLRGLRGSHVGALGTGYTVRLKSAHCPAGCWCVEAVRCSVAPWASPFTVHVNGQHRKKPQQHKHTKGHVSVDAAALHIQSAQRAPHLRQRSKMKAKCCAMNERARC